MSLGLKLVLTIPFAVAGGFVLWGIVRNERALIHAQNVARMQPCGKRCPHCSKVA